MSLARSRAGSRAASPALSVRSRSSRRAKPRTPSPPLPSSDADSESEAEIDHPKHDSSQSDSLGPAPPPPPATWQCEHCTFVNEPGVRVCVVCCRTPTVTAKIISTNAINNSMAKLKMTSSTSPVKKQEEPRGKNGKYNRLKYVNVAGSFSP